VQCIISGLPPCEWPPSTGSVQRLGGCREDRYDQSGRRPAGGTQMRWVLRLVETGDDARSRSADLMEICRPEGLREIADLGLSLPEAKQLLTSLQRAVVAGQADQHGKLRPDCRSCRGRCHVKDWRPHRIATLFGEATVRLPRFLCAACHRAETGIVPPAGRRPDWSYRSSRHPPNLWTLPLGAVRLALGSVTTMRGRTSRAGGSDLT